MCFLLVFQPVFLRVLPLFPLLALLRVFLLALPRVFPLALLLVLLRAFVMPGTMPSVVLPDALPSVYDAKFAFSPRSPISTISEITSLFAAI